MQKSSLKIAQRKRCYMEILPLDYIYQDLLSYIKDNTKKYV